MSVPSPAMVCSTPTVYTTGMRLILMLHGTEEVRKGFQLIYGRGYLGNYLIGTHVMQGRLSRAAYMAFLQDTLLLLLDDVPLQTRRQIWLMYNGTPALNSVVVRDYLNYSFPDRCGWANFIATTITGFESCRFFPVG